jgi:hypothetical protein
MSTLTTETARFDWTETGAKALPPEHRADFLRHLAGEHVDSQHDFAGHGAPRWRSPNGSFPMSPGMSLEAAIREFDIRPVTAVSHAGAWIAHDTSGKPGYFGDYTCTYTMLAVRTRKQVIHFLDGGCSIIPVAVETLPDSEVPAEFIEGEK